MMAKDELKSTTYRCSTCGCETLPPIFRTVIAEFERLGDREREAMLLLISGYLLYGKIPDRGWTNQVADLVRLYLPSFFDAKDMGGIENVLIAAHDPEYERPDGWSSEGGIHDGS